VVLLRDDDRARFFATLKASSWVVVFLWLGSKAGPGLLILKMEEAPMDVWGFFFICNTPPSHFLSLANRLIATARSPKLHQAGGTS
jgi:hypothetical protein